MELLAKEGKEKAGIMSSRILYKLILKRLRMATVSSIDRETGTFGLTVPGPARQSNAYPTWPGWKVKVVSMRRGSSIMIAR